MVIMFVFVFVVVLVYFGRLILDSLCYRRVDFGFIARLMGLEYIYILVLSIRSNLLTLTASGKI